MHGIKNGRDLPSNAMSKDVLPDPVGPTIRFTTFRLKITSSSKRSLKFRLRRVAASPSLYHENDAWWKPISSLSGALTLRMSSLEYLSKCSFCIHQVPHFIPSRCEVDYSLLEGTSLDGLVIPLLEVDKCKQRVIRGS